jgi:hypothetical protein
MEVPSGVARSRESSLCEIGNVDGWGGWAPRCVSLEECVLESWVEPDLPEHLSD